MDEHRDFEAELDALHKRVATLELQLAQLLAGHVRHAEALGDMGHAVVVGE